MERALIEREVARILAEMGVRPERLRPDARLLHDLGVEGDDATAFFDAVAARFGTDLAALHERWGEHFGPEGLRLAPVGRIAAGAAGAGLAGVLAGLPALACAALLAAGGAGAWLAGRPVGAAPRPARRPVRLSEVADAVERGRWAEPAGDGAGCGTGCGAGDGRGRAGPPPGTGGR